MFPSIDRTLFRVSHTLTLSDCNKKPGLTFNEELVAYFHEAWPSIAMSIAAAGGYSTLSLNDLNAKERICYAEVRTTHLRKVTLDFVVEKIDTQDGYDILNIWVCNALTPYDEVRLFSQCHIRRIRPNWVSAPKVTKVKPLPLL